MAVPRAAAAAFAEQAILERRALALTQHLDPVERHILHGMKIDKSSNNPITKEYGTTFFIAATALFIAATANNPVEDTKLFNRRGEIFIPIVTPALNYVMDRLGETVRPLPGVDAYENWSEEDKTKRMQILDTMGKFDRFWQDQNDDVDKMRLMHAVTERQIVGGYVESLMFPQDNTTPLAGLYRDLVIQEEGYTRPSMSYLGNELLTNRQRHGTHALQLYFNHFGLDSKFDTAQAAIADQYNKDTTLLLSDVEEYDKLFKSV
jgi:hypothetical protein